MTHHYSQVRHPVRQIPTKEQLEYAARRQAQYEADPSYSGHSAGLHPDHTNQQRFTLTLTTSLRKTMRIMTLDFLQVADDITSHPKKCIRAATHGYM